MTLDGVELSPALGIGAFAEKTLVAAGQATKVDPAASPEAAADPAPRLATAALPRRPSTPIQRAILEAEQPASPL